jgi:hypothetical protein
MESHFSSILHFTTAFIVIHLLLTMQFAWFNFHPSGLCKSWLAVKRSGTDIVKAVSHMGFLPSGFGLMRMGVSFLTHTQLG